MDWGGRGRGRGAGAPLPCGGRMGGRGLSVRRPVQESSSNTRKTLVPLTRSSSGSLVLGSSADGLGTHGRGGGGQINTGHNDTWQLEMVTKICADRRTQSGIGGAVITSIKVNNTGTGENNTFHGVMLCKRDTSGPLEIDCTFEVVSTVVSAKQLFECAVSVQHKRLAKAYFYAYSDSLKGYAVCFERFEPFAKTVKPMLDGNKLEPSEEADGKNCEDVLHYLDKIGSQKQPKIRWLYNIREVFQCLEALNKAGYGHFDLGSAFNFVYAANVPPNKIGNDDRKLKIINATQFPKEASKEKEDRLKQSQYIKFLKFLEIQGAKHLTEYESFQYLVHQLKRVDVETILKHPFLLGSSEERVTSVAYVNEMLFGLSTHKLVEINLHLAKTLPDLDWKKNVKENRGRFGTFSTNTSLYEEGFEGLARFLRNYVEHERDNNPHRHANYDVLEKLISELFPCVLSWLYTMVHC